MIAMALLAAMSTSELRFADRLVTAIVEPVLAVKQAANPVEEFRSRYRAALERVLRGQYAAFESEGLRGDIDDMMSYAERVFGPAVSEQLRPETERYLERAFRTGQAVRGVPGNVATVWDRPRQGAVEWLVNHDRFWLGRVFPEHVREPFRETIAQGLREGLGREAIARRVRGLINGTPGVPGKAELYERVVSSSVARAQNWGGAFSLESAGIEAYRWRAVGDERTCERCLLFDGQVFRTERAMSVVRRALAASPEDIAGISPWPAEDPSRNDFYIKTPEGREYLRGKDADWLQDHGMGLPPLHPGCRCTTTVVRA